MQMAWVNIVFIKKYLMEMSQSQPELLIKFDNPAAGHMVVDLLQQLQIFQQLMLAESALLLQTQLPVFSLARSRSVVSFLFWPLQPGTFPSLSGFL